MKREIDSDWLDGAVTLESVIKKESGGSGHTHVYYAAVKLADGSVVATTALIDLQNGEIGHKYIDESHGPFTFGCPKSILDRLTPTEYCHAYIWRAICRGVLPRNVDYPSYEEGVETVDDAKKWIKAKRAELKAKAAQAREGAPIVENGHYVRFKTGAYVKAADDKGEIVDYSTFRVINKKAGIYAGISADSVERKKPIKLPPRKALSTIAICSPTLEGIAESR
jgi:hypothetical protein